MPACTTGRTSSAALLAGAVPLVQTRLAVLSEVVDLLRFLFIDEDDFAIDPAAVEKSLGEGSAAVLAATTDALEPLTSWTTEQVQAAMDAALLEGLGLKRGKAYAPCGLRSAGRPSPRRCRSRWRCSARSGSCDVCERLCPPESRSQVPLVLSPQHHGVWGNWQPDGFWFR